MILPVRAATGAASDFGVMSDIPDNGRRLKNVLLLIQACIIFRMSPDWHENHPDSCYLDLLEPNNT